MKINPFSLEMKYINAKSLSYYVDNKLNLPVDIFKKIHQQVEDLHGARYVHLNLKNPKNILITDVGEAFVIDFKLACKLAIWLPRSLKKFLMTLDINALLEFQKRYAI
ncbi:hypothetical protein [Cysteiniphilum sp. QT6929]|uniref:hypothetical protein n=1 Tax=Cysteiniphilum sp. QT6929 TaxID=2975055 RepID=UPI0024B3C516|nr:hypothetical protein [Cysteiniphilum sp. QT6929]WHN66257.1 hypothetical protein NYP54_03235 [Cysteiniphilum sp. QT6929]